MDKTESERIEIRLLLEAIYLKYGYDFRDYAGASVKRRVRHRLMQSDLSSISELQHKILYDTAFFEKFLMDFSINVTAMFRDPSCYLALRRKVLPLFREHSFIRVWHAGCSTGEEVYSMAIMLREEGLYDRTRIYATDINEMVVGKAAEGIFPIDDVQEYTRNYQAAGGEESFADYYRADSSAVIMEPSLKSNIVFSDHNLVTDGVFSEMDVIVCRNVLIYFNRELQKRVLRLFYDSLAEGGILCLGSKESILFCAGSDDFETLDRTEKIYRKKEVGHGV